MSKHENSQNAQHANSKKHYVDHTDSETQPQSQTSVKRGQRFTSYHFKDFYKMRNESKSSSFNNLTGEKVRPYN